MTTTKTRIIRRVPRTTELFNFTEVFTADILMQLNERISYLSGSADKNDLDYARRLRTFLPFLEKEFIAPPYPRVDDPILILICRMQDQGLISDDERLILGSIINNRF